MLVVSLAGCSGFLDVQPRTSLPEEEFFTSPEGFQQALDGVYSLLASRDLYGDKLTMGYVSAMAQNYNITSAAGGSTLVEVVRLEHSSTNAAAHASAVWNAAYSAIANLNKIIENTTLKRNLLNENEAYQLIRGESLALRALLHFDLYRLFGKEYLANMDAKAIPYRKKVSELALAPSTSREVIQFVSDDLKEAEDLLEDTDPIVTGETTTSLPDVLFRRERLNYYGVKALQARVRIYTGDDSGAATAANVVISSGNYPFVDPADASAASNRDRLYLSEQVFMLRNSGMRGYTESYFRMSTIANSRSTRSLANFNTLYEVASGGGTDYRFLYRIENDEGIYMPSKFWQTTSTEISPTRRDAYVPVIRVSEMYYILAETAATPQEGIEYLNAVRVARGLVPLISNGTQTQLTAELLKEYQKEFYAEGQLFFYYKRTNAPTMQFKAAPTAVTPEMYVIPIPEAELQYNPNY